MSTSRTNVGWEVIAISALIAMVVLALLALTFCGARTKTAEGDGGNREQHPLLSTVRFAVPTGLMEGSYWVYLDRQIAMAGTRSIPRVASVNYGNSLQSEYHDPAGVVAQADGKTFTFVREGARSRIFEVTGDLRVAAASYEIQFVVASKSGGCVPLAYAWPPPMQLEAGAAVTVELPLPLRIDIPYAEAADVAFSYYESDPVAWFNYVQRSFLAKAKALENHPVARALFDLQLVLTNAPPHSPMVYVDLPIQFGGPRQLDGPQISLMLDGLSRCYGFHLPGGDRAFGQRGHLATVFAQLEYQIDGYNKRLSALGDIVRKLDAVGRAR